MSDELAELDRVLLVEVVADIVEDRDTDANCDGVGERKVAEITRCEYETVTVTEVLGLSLRVRDSERAREAVRDGEAAENEIEDCPLELGVARVDDAEALRESEKVDEDDCD